jgi:glycosyltransferase involved in cell wall biosynthesis
MPGFHWRFASWAAYHLASRTLVNAPRLGELVSEAEHLDPTRVTVVSNFVDEAAFEQPAPGWREQMLRELGANPECPTLGIIANLLPVKDHATLLKAVQQVRNRGTRAQVVLIGDGGERPHLEELARALGIADAVFFAGRRANTPNHHAAFDISVLCSRSEGLSNSILEAMAAGRPVVATDVGATADAVVRDETGLLVPPGDVAALAAALHRLASDPAYSRHLGDAGRRRAHAHFSADAALPLLERLYAELAAPLLTLSTPTTVPHSTEISVG